LYDFDECSDKMLTGHNNETLKLVVAISLSGSAVNFSFTAGHEQKHTLAAQNPQRSLQLHCY